MAAYKLSQIFHKLICFSGVYNALREKVEEISELTANQADDKSREWMMLRHEHVTTSFFGDIDINIQWTSAACDEATIN